MLSTLFVIALIALVAVYGYWLVQAIRERIAKEKAKKAASEISSENTEITEE